MSTAVAEAAPQTREIYGKSLGTIRRLGEASLAGTGFEVEFELAHDDFETALAEMIKTDPEYRHYLDVNKARQFAYRDGKTRAADGTPMIDVVQAGYETSVNSSDIRLSTSQVERDAGDVLVAEAADNLRVGQSMLVVSMEPKTELAGKDAKFWEKQGYRKGIAYIQWYSRTSENELWASAISVDHSDIGHWKELLHGEGVEIPDDVTPNTFIRHMHHFKGDEKTAQTVAEKLRTQYYRSVGAPDTRISITDFLRANQALTDAMFDTYVPVIGKAITTQNNSGRLQTFARQALATIPPEKLSSEVRMQLMRTANMKRFDDAMARAMNDAILYATAEQLRVGLKTIVHKPEMKPSLMPPQLKIAGVEQYAHMRQVQLQTMAVAGLQRGVEARRSYGGCSGTNLARKPEDLLKPLINPQDIFGGNDASQEEDSGPDGLGPLTFKCTEGHVNTRTKGEILKECQTKPCKEGSVGCA